MATQMSTPGVYIQELTGPLAAVAVATAVPAFIGYTPQAQDKGESLYNQARRITSLADFEACFLQPAPAPRYNPEYHVRMTMAGLVVLPDPDTLYYLYNSVRLFYANGGRDAYIVAVGSYGPPSKAPVADPAAAPVNANVRLADLQRGLAVLQGEQDPTIYICPEATLLSPADNATLMQDMLAQADKMQTALCLFDVIGGATPDPVRYTADIEAFRDGTGSTGLKYGVSYYPFIGTTIMQPAEINFTNLFGGDIGQLAALVNPPSAPNPAVAQLLAQIGNHSSAAISTGQLHAALLAASVNYLQIVTRVLEVANILPPSGAMAGLYATKDREGGVWEAPANMGIASAVSLPIRLNDAQQANLNIDISGKSVNAIRFFDGRGILVWGARTLDANSQDWRYISVRRTVTFLEQTIKLAAQAYVFEPNDARTWAVIGGMVDNFLTGVWRQGGLCGDSPTQAFHVSCGLGTSMTADDVAHGRLRIYVSVALVRPAEFLVFALVQQQANAG